MKERDAAMERYREIISRQLEVSQYRIWTVGEFPYVHITCTPGSLRTCEYAADRVISEMGGTRYASSTHGTGLLGFGQESSFCFKVQ